MSGGAKIGRGVALWCMAAAGAWLSLSHGEEAKPQAALPAIRLKQVEGTEAPRVELVGLSADQLARLAAAKLDPRGWAQVFSLRVGEGNRREVPPVLGSYRLRERSVEFTPRFPLRPGVEYVAAFDPAAIPGAAGKAGRRVEVVLSLPKADAVPAAVVTAVYPSADALPENLLKFYIHFSAPMIRGESYRRIRLVDRESGEVADPFLEIGEELWDASGRRLTLLFDLGRIKRGLKPREEAGPPLVEGRSYGLAIDRQWRDAQGLPLAKEFHKDFRATAPDETQPNPRRWKLVPPAAGTQDALVVTFDEPLDHAMLERVIEVLGPEDRSIDGELAVEDHERRWTFRPTLSWHAGAYQLSYDAALEDRAGNSVARRFEVDASVADDEHARDGKQILLFKIR